VTPVIKQLAYVGGDLVALSDAGRAYVLVQDDDEKIAPFWTPLPELPADGLRGTPVEAPAAPAAAGEVCPLCGRHSSVGHDAACPMVKFEEVSR
jgi:hypothetical protein